MSDLTAESLIATIKAEIENPPPFFESMKYTHQHLHWAIEAGREAERERVINLLLDLKAIRRDALGDLVAFNTDGTEVIYLPGLEGKNK